VLQVLGNGFDPPKRRIGDRAIKTIQVRREVENIGFNPGRLRQNLPTNCDVLRASFDTDDLRSVIMPERSAIKREREPANARAKVNYAMESGSVHGNSTCNRQGGEEDTSISLLMLGTLMPMLCNKPTFVVCENVLLQQNARLRVELALHFCEFAHQVLRDTPESRGGIARPCSRFPFL
jgi:hypothetical protein